MYRRRGYGGNRVRALRWSRSIGRGRFVTSWFLPIYFLIPGVLRSMVCGDRRTVWNSVRAVDCLSDNLQQHGCNAYSVRAGGAVELAEWLSGTGRDDRSGISSEQVERPSGLSRRNPDDATPFSIGPRCFDRWRWRRSISYFLPI